MSRRAITIPVLVAVLAAAVVPGSAQAASLSAALSATGAQVVTPGAATTASPASSEPVVPQPEGARDAAVGELGEPEISTEAVLVRPEKGADPAEVERLLDDLEPGDDRVADGGDVADREPSAVPGTSWVTVPIDDERPQEALTRMRRDPLVAAAEPVLVRRPSRTPNDPVYSSAQSRYLSTIRMPEAWDITRGSTSVVVAVLDSGVRATHQDLRGRLVGGYDAVDRDSTPTDGHGHGTNVSGVISAATGNGVGGAGVGWSTRVMPVRVLGDDGTATDPVIAAGIRWAVDRGADVINLSLGGYGSSNVLRDAVAYAIAKDVVVVAAAGNESTSEPSYPAAYPGVVSVGATDHAGSMAGFSNWGPHQALAAPGAGITTTDMRSDASYASVSGTSFSAPIVAGVAALVRARFPKLTAGEVVSRLRSTAHDAGPRGIDPYYGSGLVDAAAALGAPVAPALPLQVEPASEPGSTPGAARPAVLPQRASTTPEGDVDWWAVDATSLPLRIRVAPTSGSSQLDAVVEVYDSALTKISEVDRAYEGQAEQLALDVPETGRYYVVVRNFSGAAGASTGYTISTASSVAPRTPLALGPAWLRDVRPAPNASGVPLSGPVTLDLGRDLDASSVSSTTVSLRDGTSGDPVAATVSYDAAARRITLQPRARLLPNHAYGVRVQGVKDVGQAAFTDGFSWSFTTAVPSGLRFTPVDPVRVLDTRKGTGASRSIIPSGGHVDLQVTGRAGVPASAQSVVLNVTSVRPAREATVQIYPTPASPGPVPEVSNLNMYADEVAANLVTVRVGAGGKVRLRTTSRSHLVADLAGFYAPTGPTGYTPLAPARLLDTREGTGAPPGRLRAGEVLDLPVAGRFGVPHHAKAVVMNVTAVKPISETYLKVFPTPLAGTAQPLVSNINLTAGQTRANLVTVKLGRDGRVRMTNASGTIDVVADIAGYYAADAATGFVPVAPVRVLDTRFGTGVRAGVVPFLGSVDLPLGSRPDAPRGAVAAVLNVTGVKPAGGNHLTVWPTPAGSAAPPLASTLNLPADTVRPNLAIGALGDSGQLRFTTGGPAMHVVADLAGWFTP